MGNTPSVEVPRRVPQKLSKSRTSSYGPAGVMMSPNGIATTLDGQSSNPGYVGPSYLYPFSPLSSPATRTPSTTTVPEAATTPFPNLDDTGTSTSAAPDSSAGETPSDRRASMLLLGKQRLDRNRRSIFRSKSSSKKEQDPAREKRPERRNTIVTAPISQPLPPLPPLEGQGQPASDNVFVGEVGESPQPGLLRADSWQPQVGSRVSWNYDFTSYEAKRLLSLVEEPVRFEAETAVSERKAFAVSEVTWKSSHPARPAPPEPAAISRANSDLSMYTPVRRRSVIQTPGVATRQNSITGPRANIRHSHPPTPSLSRQASFESAGGRVLSMPPPRHLDPDAPLGLVTPSEGDYQTFGAFKLGTLRIMNGNASPIAASPEPDEKYLIHQQAPPDFRAQADYFPSQFSPSAGASERVGEASSAVIEAPASSAAPVAAQPPTILTVATTFVTPAHVQQTLVPELARDAKNGASAGYLGEIQFSPFELRAKSPASPQLQTTSKHTALEDHLFEDEPQSEYAAGEVLDLRMDPNAKPASLNVSQLESQPSQRSSTSATTSVTRSDSGIVASPTSDASHKPLSKTDSGYSSNVSLRSLRGGSKPPMPDKDRAWAIASEVLPSPNPRGDGFLGDVNIPSPTVIAISEKAAPTAPLRSPPPPPPPPKDMPATGPPAAKPSNPTTPKVSRSVDRTSVGHMSASSGISKRRSGATLAPITSSRTRDFGPRSPESPASPQSATSDTSGSALSIGSGSQKPGRLHRFLSLGSTASRPRGPPTVHATHVDGEADIPSVPHDVQRQLNARSGQFPMTTKRLALRPQISKETLQTIFSVGSLELTGLEGQSTDNLGRQTPNGLNRRHTFTPSSLAYSTTTTAAVSLQQPIPRKPVPIAKDSTPASKQPEMASVPPHSRISVAVPQSEAGLAISATVTNTHGADTADWGLFFSPTGQAMSAAAQLERNVGLRSGTTALQQQSSSQNSPVSPSMPSPLIPEVVPRKNLTTPPPISARARRHGQLRVPPPLRPQSTPPRAEASSSSSSSSRQTKLQNLHHRHSAYQLGTPASSSSLAPPVPTLNPRRSMILQSNSWSGPGFQQPQQYRVPDWRVKTDHDNSHRATTLHSHDGQHNTSLARGHQTSQGYDFDGPLSPPQQQQGPPPNHLLRHRASYDGYNYHRQIQQKQLQEQRYYGNRGGAGLSKKPPMADPRRRQTFNAQALETDGQCDRYPGAQPPYVPRGGSSSHHRSRSMSMGADGGAEGRHYVPYRILHSYNSPAYRNAPIWG